MRLHGANNWILSADRARSRAADLAHGAIKDYTPCLVRIDQSNPVITIAGVAWGIIIFGETHSTWVWLSPGLTMIGLNLVTQGDVRSRLIRLTIVLSRK